MLLDDAYANAAYIPNGESYPGRWTEAAEAFRKSVHGQAQLNEPYGPSPRQCYDFFPVDGRGKGTMIFVHGGYWIKFDKSVWSHLALGAAERGWNAALPGYDLCPDVRIADITRQIARAVTAVAQRTDGPITLAGHSAGGHLVARMLAPGLLPDDVLARIVAVAPISPVADLRPLLKTSMNAQFNLTMEDAEAESPIFQATPATPVKIWVGADERPSFLEQADALARAWGVPQVVKPGRHHFDIVDALTNPKSDMMRFLTP